VVALCSCGSGSVRQDFTRPELQEFYDRHREACRASSAEIFKHKDFNDFLTALEKHIAEPVAGTVLGTRITWPDSRDKDEGAAWYVGGDNGCLYYCDRQFGNVQPFGKADRVRLETWDVDSGDGTMMLEKDIDVKVHVVIQESLRPK